MNWHLNEYLNLSCSDTADNPVKNCCNLRKKAEASITEMFHLVWKYLIHFHTMFLQVKLIWCRIQSALKAADRSVDPLLCSRTGNVSPPTLSCSFTLCSSSLSAVKLNNVCVTVAHITDCKKASDGGGTTHWGRDDNVLPPKVQVDKKMCYWQHNKEHLEKITVIKGDENIQLLLMHEPANYLLLCSRRILMII